MCAICTHRVYSADPDMDFLAMMIPASSGRVDMERLQLMYGRDPLVRKLAEDIIAAKQVEIEAMSAGWRYSVR